MESAVQGNNRTRKDRKETRGKERKRKGKREDKGLG
jgi:hypothetical protein